MVKVANFDPEFADLTGGSTGVIAETAATGAVTTHAADTTAAHQSSGVAVLDAGGASFFPLLPLSSGTANRGRLASTDVEGAIAEIAGALGMSDAPVGLWPLLPLSSGVGVGKLPHLTAPAAHEAANVTIADVGGYFVGGDVERALQQIGASGGAAFPGVVGGYAPLSSGLLVPVGYLGSATPDATKFLRGDGTWAVPPSAGAFIGVRAYHSTTQNISGAEAAAALDSEEYDSDGFHSTTTNNSRLTVPAGLGGMYLLIGHIQTTGGGQVSFSFRRGGTTAILGAETGEAPTGSGGYQVIAVVALAAGEYVEMMVYEQDSETIGHAMAALKTSFSATRLG